MAMNKKIIFSLILAFLFAVCGKTEAQTFKYWVKFTNKNGTPYSINTPTAFLSPKSIQRRANQGIAIDATDLPVTPAYVNSVSAVPQVTVLYRSKWMNGVVVKCPATATTAING